MSIYIRIEVKNDDGRFLGPCWNRSTQSNCAVTMNNLGLPGPNRCYWDKTTVAQRDVGRFYFTKKGWAKCGTKLRKWLRSIDVEIRILIKREHESEVIYSDDLQAVLI